MKEVIRFILRVAVTPMIVLAYGFFWCGFMGFLGPAFAFVSFLEKQPFKWKDWLKENNEFFVEPLREIWRIK